MYINISTIDDLLLQDEDGKIWWEWKKEDIWNNFYWKSRYYIKFPSCIYKLTLFLLVFGGNCWLFVCLFVLNSNQKKKNKKKKKLHSWMVRQFQRRVTTSKLIRKKVECTVNDDIWRTFIVLKNVNWKQKLKIRS